MDPVLQQTIKFSTSSLGIGLHTGREITFKICPAAADSGIIFKRTDVKTAESIIPASYKNVIKTQLGTVIANKYRVEISTIEHLMAAFWGMGIDNAIVEIDGPEVPIMDGSSAPFIFMLEAVGLKPQNKPKSILRVLDKVKIGDTQKSASFEPGNGFGVNFEIGFDTKAIKHNNASFDLTPVQFKNEIAEARTFGFKHEVDYLRSIGLARGGSLDNAIVIEKDTVLNKEGLRFDDEFVRHKVLDAIGDMYLAGMQIEGTFSGNKSGHGLNNDLIHELMETKGAWEIIPATELHTRIAA